MKTPTTFRTKVFKRAHHIKATTGKGFAVCLAKAWALYRLAKRMRVTKAVRFSYEKKDGSLRQAFGTLLNVAKHIKGTGKPLTSVFHYWDVEANAFRCFKIENLVTIY